MLRDHILQLAHQAKLAARNLLRQRKRTLLALTTVAGGVVALLLAGGFFNWILESMRETTIHSQLGHLQITRPAYFQEGLNDPYNYLLPPRLPGQIDTVAGVVTVTPRLAFSGLISKGDETVSFIGDGVDPVKEEPVNYAIVVVGCKPGRQCR